MDKTYIATIDFSQKSDTWDTQYREYHEQLDPETLQAPSLEAINELLQNKLGTTPFPLTPFSAKKVDGKKLYEYAREGNPIFMDVDMTVHSFKIVSYSFPQLELEISVGSGTYIRSIAHRIGEQF